MPDFTSLLAARQNTRSFITAALLCLAAAGQGEPANLLTNSGFEEGARPDQVPLGWSSYVPNGTARIQTVPGEGRAQGHCATVQTDGDLTALLVSHPPLPVAPGEMLDLSVWYRTEDVTTSTGGNIVFSAGFLDEKGRYVDWSRATVEPGKPGEWKELRHQAVVPARAAGVVLQAGLKASTGKTWWDDAVLRAPSAQVVRFSGKRQQEAPGATKMPLVLINRETASAGQTVEIRIKPGGQVVGHTLSADLVTTLTVPVTLQERGSNRISAVLSHSGQSGQDFRTSVTLEIPPLLVADPPSPTHYILEPGKSPEVEAWIEIHETPEARRQMQVRGAVLDASGGVVAERLVSAGEAGPLAFTVSLPPEASRRPGEYRLRIELRRAGQTLASEEQPWHLVSGPTTRTDLSSDGNLYVNGKPFFPIGLYMGKNFPELAEAGFNVMQSYPAFAGPASSNRSVLEFMDRTHKAGMKALTFISHGPDRLSDEEALRRIRMFRNHPALLVWYQEEAVDRGYKPLSYMENLYKTLKRESPEFPVMVGDRRDVAAKMNGRSDFFPDPFMDMGIWWWYPTPLRPTPNTEGYEGEPTGPELEYKAPPFLSDSNTSKPLWVALQCYRKPGVSDARFPTPEEYRAQAYIAICGGAKGLLYYTGTGERGSGVQNRPDEGHWEELKAVVSELREMSPVFLAPDAAAGVTVSPSEAMVSTRLKQVGPRRVLLAVNRSIRPVEVTLRIDGARKGEVQVLKENRSVAVQGDGTLKDNFGPYAVHLYELPG